MNILNLLNIKLLPGNQFQTSAVLRTTQPKFSLLSGGVSFLKRVLGLLGGCQRVIVTFGVTRQGASRSTLQRHTRDGRALLTEFGLRPLVVGDAEAGGATDAQHLFGFGSDIGSPCLPVVEVGLHRTLRHVLDGGVEGCFPTVLKAAIPQLERPARAVLWHNGATHGAPRKLCSGMG